MVGVEARIPAVAAEVEEAVVAPTAAEVVVAEAAVAITEFRSRRSPREIDATRNWRYENRTRIAAPACS